MNLNPTVAIIIPVYRHSVFVVEALESALAQEADFDISIVVVDDGCPFFETFSVGTSYAFSKPNVIYVRKNNQGLSSARNVGFDLAFELWPSLAAVYFLDADNRLSPKSIKKSFDYLMETKSDWVYPDIDKFGIEWSGSYAIPYSKLLHVTFDNICEAGSLVARSVFAAGVKFDESMQSGFEDWEFWLQALEKKLVGVHSSSLGLEYRQRAESMLSDSNRSRQIIIDYMRKKHPDLYAINNLLAWEHEESPRFCLFTNAGFSIKCFTDPVLRARIMNAEQFTSQFWAETINPQTYGTPPYYIWCEESLFDEIVKIKIANYLLWELQQVLEDFAFVALRFEYNATNVSIEKKVVGRDAPIIHAPSAWATKQSIFRSCVLDHDGNWITSLASDTPDPNILEISIFAPFSIKTLDGVRESATKALLRSFDFTKSADCINHHNWLWKNSDHLPGINSYYKILEESVGSGPLTTHIGVSRRYKVGFAIPIGAYGGVERVLYAISQVLTRYNYDCILYIVGKPEMVVMPGVIENFSAIFFIDKNTLTKSMKHEVFSGHHILTNQGIKQEVQSIIGAMDNLDMLICSHVAELSPLLGVLKKRGLKIVNYLHVIDQTVYGRKVGHPYINLAFEHIYEIIITCSHNLSSWLHGMGVPQEKLMVIKNAPSYELDLLDNTDFISLRKQLDQDAPLQVIFLGRLDFQKGTSRLLAIIERCKTLKLPVCWRIIGGEVISDNKTTDFSARLRAMGITIEFPKYNNEALSEIYAESDILILPSRWEGAPLSVLEAQRLGCVPLTTDVGAVSELVEHLHTGILVSNENDISVVDSMLSWLTDLSIDRGRLAYLSKNCMNHAADRDWQTNAGPLLSYLDKIRSDKYHSHGVFHKPEE